MRKKYCSIMSERCRCSRIFYASIHFVPLMHKIWSSLSIIRKCNSHNRVEKYNIFYSAADCNFLHPLQEVLCQWSYLFCLCIPCECMCRFLFLCVCDDNAFLPCMLTTKSQPLLTVVLMPVHHCDETLQCSSM